MAGIQHFLEKKYAWLDFIAYQRWQRTLVISQRFNPIYSTKESLNSVLIIDNHTELKTFEWDILNPDQFINLEINN